MKVLVFGPGDNQERVAKANAVNAKNGPFDWLVLLGDEAPGLECDVPIFHKGLKRVGTDVSIASESDDLVDVLCTEDWPEGLQEGKGTECARKAVQTSKPRYHFASNGDEFHEHAAYTWGGSDRFTRFINLDKFGGSSKWFYAFNIDSNKGEAPPGAIDNPWEEALKKKRTREEKLQKKRKQRKTTVTPDTCFFCLSCPQLDKELVVSIADESYMALAKGPLTTPQHTNGMQCPAHVLVIPVAHVPSFTKIQDESMVKLERKKYMVALKQMYEPFDMTCVAFEISRSTGVHAHMQVVPIPKSKQAEIEQFFISQAEAAGMAMLNRSVDADETEFFRVTLPNDDTLVIEIAGKFDLQFGRKVLAKFLGVENRIDWRACAQTTAEEARDAAQFKSLFKPYDFTL